MCVYECISYTLRYVVQLLGLICPHFTTYINIMIELDVFIIQLSILFGSFSSFIIVKPGGAEVCGRVQDFISIAIVK